ncbi:hypothetical protein N0V90_006876 [Kalmusia sp. IMI 367209]|nr:hypothetical protein N0V90_006876 [Kalmusia sp. IMI 367209]
MPAPPPPPPSAHAAHGSRSWKATAATANAWESARGKAAWGSWKTKGALLSDINKGARLKKVTQVNDRSAPQVGKVSDGPSGPPIGGAPPIPGMGRAPAPPSGLAPPVPGNRARSNSDTGGDGARDGGMASAAPQLGGLFAGGMPKLRKSGGVNTGAESSSPYLSDPETSRTSAPKPPRGSAPKPPGAAPPIPGGRPPTAPGIAALRNNLRPSSMVSTHSMPDIGSKPKPPLPGKKPPIPPPSSRKPSGLAPQPPASPARAPPVPGIAPPAPPPPPPSHSPSAPPPPPPPVSTPQPHHLRRLLRLGPQPFYTPPPPPAPPARTQHDEDDDEYDPYRYTSTPPKPPSAPAPPAPKATTNGTPSLAEQAARNAFGRLPAAPPPLHPQHLLQHLVHPHLRPRQSSQAPLRSMLDPSSYTLTNGGSGVKGGPTSPGMSGPGQKAKIVPIHDLRWRFIDESQFPRPREFLGGAKKYRAGRGCSVPLDLSAFE